MSCFCQKFCTFVLSSYARGRDITALMVTEDIREVVRRADGITEFQRRVYMAVLEVPRGETVTYGELARRIGCGSAQAVGQALRRNPFAPSVPCHRVVARDGIGGFHGQRCGEMIDRKRKLLAEERAVADVK